jgi:hypothetical protein
MFNVCVERHIILGRVGMELLSGAKNKKIIALVDIVLIGKGIDGMISWNSDIRHPVLPCTVSCAFTQAIIF